MQTPRAEIDATAAAHAKLHTAVAELSDPDMRAPSLLPEWTIGHLLTHLARNADSVVRRLEGAVADRLVPQYEGGWPGRAAEIEAGADRSAAQILADLREADERVDGLFASVDPAAWGRQVLRGGGDARMPAADLAFSRWREVEVHLVDLGRGYRPADWPDALVERWLPSLLSGLADRADDRTLMAWLLGRAGAPDLGPWG